MSRAGNDGGDGGSVIPAALMEELVMQMDLPLPFPRTKYPPLTRQQKVRRWFRLLPSRVKWRIHDALFGHDDYEDDR